VTPYEYAGRLFRIGAGLEDPADLIATSTPASRGCARQV